MRLAVSYMNANNYPAALNELLQAEKHDPNNPLIHQNLAQTYFFRDRLDLSEKHFRRALGLNPRFTEARVDLARVLIDTGKYEDAREELLIAKEDLVYANPAKVEANLGYSFFQQKHYPDAIKYLSQALRLNPSDCFAANYYGRSLFENKDYSAATRALDRAVLLCKPVHNDEPHYYAALAWFRSGDSTKAAARFREVIDDYKNGKYEEKSRAMLETLKEIQ